MRGALLFLGGCALLAAACSSGSASSGKGAAGDGGNGGGSGGGSGDAATEAGAVPDAFVAATVGPGPQSPNSLCQLGTVQPWLDVGTPTGNSPTRVADGSSEPAGVVHVACTVQASGGGFDVALNAVLEGLQGGSLTVTSPPGAGAVSLASGGTGITAVFQSAENGTFQASDCTLTFQYEGGAVPDTPPIAPGRIWGHVSCPAARSTGQTVTAPDGGSAARQCDGEADFLFEQCAGY